MVFIYRLFVRQFIKDLQTASKLIGTFLRKVLPVSKNEDVALHGLNVAGYITSESGVGEAVRANIKAAQSVGIPLALNNITSSSRQTDDSYTAFSSDNPYQLNLIQVNADQTTILYQNKGRKFFKNKYNIGFWYWELRDFPAELSYCFDLYDEIWVASSFCQEAISQISPLPVVKIPPSVVVDRISPANRESFGLPDGTFVFLFMFDFLSSIARKNPFAVIKAFGEAFRHSDDVLLLIKCSNSDQDPPARDQMLAQAGGLPVKFIDDYLLKSDVNALVSLCDCYVSLHRSEGFGLPLAEAMFLKKPVIATGYSGNMEFMDVNNSLLVKHRLIEIEADWGPYKKGNVWADPDIIHAAQQMRLVYENRALATAIGERAAQDIRAKLGSEVIGNKIRERIVTISSAQRL